MKKLAILACTVFALAAMSCGHSTHKAVNRVDSVYALIRNPNSGRSFLIDSGVLHFETKEVLDTQTDVGKWISDSTLYIKQAVDTLRDKSGKPLFDTAHRVLFRLQYLPVPDSLYQIIHIPHTPFN